jgi:hypothetical protein
MKEHDSPDRGSREVEYRDLQPVFRGSMPEVLTLQSALMASGIESFIPDYTIKTIDPFITGKNVFEVSLHVPAKQVAEAEAEIRRLRAQPEEPGGESRGSGSQSEVDVLGRRIRWASVSIITAPVGVLWGIKYIGEARSLPEKPTYDLLTKICFAICILESLSIASVLVVGLRGLLFWPSY